ncbi:MAG: hypothetical protein PHE67_00100 [Campylobacterales bacterium]|nr:hypothetical protein [Campylobacterales bacterium]
MATDSVLKKLMQAKKSDAVELVTVTLQVRKTDLLIVQKKAELVDMPVEELMVKYLSASSAFKSEKKSSSRPRKQEQDSVQKGGES